MSTVATIKNPTEEMSWITKSFLVLFGFLGMAVGVMLFFLSESTETTFAWTIKLPLSAAILGAGYMSSILIAPMALREKYWARSQTSFIGFLPGLALILFATVMHLDVFHFNSPSLIAQIVAWGWVIGYTGVTAAMIAMLYLQMRQPDMANPPALALPSSLKILFGIVAVGAIIPSLIFVLIPSVLIPWWPWPITALVGRMLGAFLAAQGSSAVLALRANDSHKIRMMCTGYILFVVLQVIAIIRYSSVFTLFSVGGIGYALLLAVILLTGLLGIRQAQHAASLESQAASGK